MTANPQAIQQRRRSGFTLTEAILTIAIIGVMASLVVGAISNASRDAQRIVSRQQQAAVQNAISAWVMAQTRNTTTGQVKSINEIRTYYNSITTAKDKLITLLAPSPLTGTGGFLDKATADHFLAYTTNSAQLKTSALSLARQHLELPTWNAGGFPQVDLVND